MNKKSDKRHDVSWDPDQNYEVEKIIKHQTQNNETWYLVKWKGWPSKYNTYENLDNLNSCNYLMMKYYERNKPSKIILKEMDSIIEKQVSFNPFYRRMQQSNYSRRDLLVFFNELKNFTIDYIFKGKQINTKLTWLKNEYKYIIRCLVAMGPERDQKMFVRAQNYLICLKLLEKRRTQLQTITISEADIVKIGEKNIKIENKVDFECFPKFYYVTKMICSNQLIIPNDPPLGCECVTGCDSQSACCGIMAGSTFAYTKSGKLKAAEKIPIYECNRRCKCLSNCPNRIVQNGRKVELCIFKTESCGWGVKTLQVIKRGTFVCEYIGELISEKEAANRVETYLFDLDFNWDTGSQTDPRYCIDCNLYGNVARFINHSCNPNLQVVPVWIDCLDPNLPRLAFFASRSIAKNEEITFDYRSQQDEMTMTGDGLMEDRRPLSKIKCECKARECRRWLFKYE